MTRPNPATFGGAMQSLNLDIPQFDPSTIRRMQYPELARTKRTVEDTLETLFDVLQNTYKCDMSSPLVVDGFPRNDVDVVSVRLVRTNIIRLRNDHSLVLEMLEKQLEQRLLAGLNQGMAALQISDLDLPPVAAKTPFATVREVAPGGPAEAAGLQVGDRLTVFDRDIDASNHQRLAALATRVQAKLGRALPVQIVRLGRAHTLTLVPAANWGGRGVLGCHLVPC